MRTLNLLCLGAPGLCAPGQGAPGPGGPELAGQKTVVHVMSHPEFLQESGVDGMNVLKAGLQSVVTGAKTPPRLSGESRNPVIYFR